jgi:hypothetical protein
VIFYESIFGNNAVSVVNKIETGQALKETLPILWKTACYTSNQIVIMKKNCSFYFEKSEPIVE